MQNSDYKKAAIWLLNNNYGNSVLIPLFNKVFAKATDSMMAVKILKDIPYEKNLYTFFKEIGKFKPDAITENELNEELFDKFITSGGDTYHLAQMGAGYRKKRRSKRKTSKKGSKKGKKTRRH